MEPTAVITGASGFVGRRLVLGLRTLGWTVCALTARPELLAGCEGVRVAPTDWTSEGWKRAIELAGEAALWVHAAAAVEFGGAAGPSLYAANALSTGLLAAHLAIQSGSRLLYLSSIGVYGSGQQCAAGVNPMPDTHYGMSKLLGEHLVQAHLGERSSVLRLAGVWGSELSPKLFVNRCLNQARQGMPMEINGDGSGRRNYVWVGDLPAIVDQHAKAAKGGVSLVAGPESLSTREMTTAIAEHFGVTVRFDDRAGAAPGVDCVVEATPGLPVTAFRNALAQEAQFCA